MTGKLGKCISPACVTAAPMTIAYAPHVGNAPKGRRRATIEDGGTDIKDATTGETLFIAKAQIFNRYLKLSVTDAKKKLVCAAFGLVCGGNVDGLRVMRPVPAYQGQEKVEGNDYEGPGGEALYIFGAVTVDKSAGVAKYVIIKADEEGPHKIEIYTATKVRSFSFMMSVACTRAVEFDEPDFQHEGASRKSLTEHEERLVAKVSESADQNITVELGKGADMLATTLLTALMGVSTSSSGAHVVGIV
jgi:hypothetical protein